MPLLFSFGHASLYETNGAEQQLDGMTMHFTAHPQSRNRTMMEGRRPW